VIGIPPVFVGAVNEIETEVFTGVALSDVGAVRGTLAPLVNPNLFELPPPNLAKNGIRTPNQILIG
jgi:hypothetical protein